MYKLALFFLFLKMNTPTGTFKTLWLIILLLLINISVEHGFKMLLLLSPGAESQLLDSCIHRFFLYFHRGVFSNQKRAPSTGTRTYCILLFFPGICFCGVSDSYFWRKKISNNLSSKFMKFFLNAPCLPDHAKSVTNALTCPSS